MPGKSPQKEVGSSCTTGYLSHGFEFHLSDQDSGVYDYELLYLMVALNAWFSGYWRQLDLISMSHLFRQGSLQRLAAT